MRKYRCVLFGFQLAALGCYNLMAATQNQESPKEQGMLERITHPDRNSKSAYDGKVYSTAGSFSDRKVSTREFEGSKAFASKEFITKSFAGEKKSWLGNLLFPSKKLPENLQGVSRDSTKEFASKVVPKKNFSDLDKKSSYASKEAFETKEMLLKGKTQGAIDNDPHLQEAVKKGLSVDDVRKLLNKAP